MDIIILILIFINNFQYQVFIRKIVYFLILNFMDLDFKFKKKN
jgi:hypothetical protein